MKPWILIFLLLPPLAATAQEQNSWHTLAKVTFQTKKDKSGYDVEVPIFSQPLKALHNTKIKLKGYIIPLEEVGGQGKFMFSSLPFNLCFFCGAAGPETVVEVQASDKISFTTQQITLEGTLLLNDKDPDHHMYIVTAAKRLNP
jgi:hypothetical protein